MAAPLLFEEWMALLEKVFSYNFENQEDIVLWKWCRKKPSPQNLYMIIFLRRGIQIHSVTSGKPGYPTK